MNKHRPEKAMVKKDLIMNNFVDPMGSGFPSRYYPGRFKGYDLSPLFSGTPLKECDKCM